jgi:hypothetical protein
VIEEEFRTRARLNLRKASYDSFERFIWKSGPNTAWLAPEIYGWRAEIMSKTTYFLASTLNKGVKLWIERGRLCYRAPQGALSPADIATLQEMKDDILSLLTRTKASHIETPKVTMWAPLTFQQEVYWDFFCSNDPTWNHFISFALRLRGMLDVDVLSKAMSALTARHESLRTRICPVAGTLMQEIDEPDKDKLQVLNLSADGGTDIDEPTRRYVERLFRKRVDPGVDPTFEAHLLILPYDEYVLAVGVHHVLSDAMSISLFFRELWVLYGDFLRGRPSSLPEVPMQYSDYASWQHRTRARWLQEHGGYWKARLAGTSRLRLPIDNGSRNIRPFSASPLHIKFGETLSSALHDLARSEKTSLALVLLAVYSAVSSFWCKQRDFVIPFNVTGRCKAEHVNVMGLFFHSLPLRVELNGTETFIELLQRISREFFTAHQHTDSGTLMREVPHLYEGTILQYLSLQPEEVSGISSPPEGENGNLSLIIEPFHVEQNVLPETFHLQSDIRLGYQDTAQGIHVYVVYRADLFTENTMQAFFADLSLFSDFVTKDPHAIIKSFGELSPPRYGRPRLSDSA